MNKKFVWKSEETQNYRDTIDLYEEDFLLLQTHLGQATSEQDINENVDRFSKLMSNICDPFFAKAVKPNNFDNITSNNTNKQPWFDEECSEKRQIFYKALENFRANKNALNQRNLSEARKIFKNVIRRKRYAFDKSKTGKLITSKSSNIKEYWRLLKKAANIQTGSSVSASRFTEYFRAINNPDDHLYQADEDVIFFNERYLNGEYQVMFNELNVEISYDEIKKAVKQLRYGASAGPDLYINEFFKNGTDIMINYIYMLFNKIFELGYFPEKWSEGYIIPIFKQGDTNGSQSIRTQVNSHSSQFVLILVNSYSKFWSIRTHLVNSYSCLVNSYSFWSIRSHFGQFVLKLKRVHIDQNEYELTENSS